MVVAVTTPMVVGCSEVGVALLNESDDVSTWENSRHQSTS